MSLQLLPLALCLALRLLYLPLALCSALSPSLPSLPRLLSLPGFVSQPQAPLSTVSDESSGIGMKVTQGNKGSAVSTAVGVESSTQEFPARLLSPSGLLPCTMGRYPPGTGRDASQF